MNDTIRQATFRSWSNPEKIRTVPPYYPHSSPNNVHTFTKNNSKQPEVTSPQNDTKRRLAAAHRMFIHYKTHQDRKGDTDDGTKADADVASASMEATERYFMVLGCGVSGYDVCMML